MTDLSCCNDLASWQLLLQVAAVVWLPGLALGALVGLRGLILLGTAPVLTFGIAAALITPAALGVPWTPATVAVGAALVLAVVATARRLGHRARPDGSPGRRVLRLQPRQLPAVRPWEWLLVAAGVLLAANVVVTTFSTSVEALGAVPQSFDAPFHLNAIRLISETADADPRALGDIQHYENADTVFFYPNGFHAVASLVYGAGSASVPAVLSAFMLVATALVLPLGVAALARAGGLRPVGIAVAAAASTWFTTFPYDLWRWGQLFAYVAGAVLLCGFLALLLHCWDRPPRFAAAAGFAAAGLLAVHPGVALAGAVAAGLMVGQRVVTTPAGQRGRTVVTAAQIGAVAFLLSLPAVAGVVDAAGIVAAWESPLPALTVEEATRQALLFRHDQLEAQTLLATLAAVGVLVVLVRRREWVWCLAVGLFFVASFVVAATSLVDYAAARTITGFWYNDRWRILAQVPLFAALVIGIGLDECAAVLRRGMERLADDRLRPLVAPGVALLAAGGVWTAYIQTDDAYLARNAERFDYAWSPGPLVSDLEIQGMRRLAELVGPDDRVMNDPRDGSAYVYALTGVRTVFGHVDYVSGRNQALLGRSFSDLDDRPSVRRAIRELEVTHVVKAAGAVPVGDDTFDYARGLQDLPGAERLKLVYLNPEFAIYEVDRRP